MAPINFKKNIMHLLALAFLVVFASCTNNTNDPAAVENGITDSTSLFAPDTLQVGDSISNTPKMDSSVYQKD